MNRKKILPIGFMLMLAASESLQANQYKEWSLEKKVERSNLVVVAKVLSVSKDCIRSSKCAEISVSALLKGDAKEKALVLFDGPIAEFNPNCCEVGQTYVFFLTQVQKGFFKSTNGPFGVYRVGP